jgi:putative SOS response-associated peptidase YedK
LPAAIELGAKAAPLDIWFALNESRPLFCFAGIWTEFKGDRGTKSKPIPGPHLVYGFLTTAPNTVVEPIHPKAMPVILTNCEERDVWMRRRLPPLSEDVCRSAAILSAHDYASAECVS